VGGREGGKAGGGEGKPEALIKHKKEKGLLQKNG